MELTKRLDNALGRCDEKRDEAKLKKRHEETIQEFVNKYQADIEEMKEEVNLCEKTSRVFKQISDTRNKQAKEKIEQVLNYALSEIPLEQTYQATLEESSSKRSGKEMRIVLTDVETGFQRGLKNQTGTWVKQLVSFILNMIIIKFSGASRILVLDEVFSGIEDQKMIKMFGEILTSLAENEDFQIIMVEHGKELDDIEGIDNIELGIKEYQSGTEIVN